MPAGVGVFYPAGVSSPNAWDTLDFDSTTNLSAIPDMTSAVQAAINAASASGYGGDVMLPAGVIRLNGVTINAGGVNLIGAGWEEFTAGAKSLRGKRGTYILTDSTANPTITIGPAAFKSRVEGMAFLQTQPPDGSQWAPTVFKPSILVNGSAQLHDLLFWGCYTGIQIGTPDPTTPTPAGNVTARDIHGACFMRLIDVQISTNQLVLDNINHLPDLFLAGNAGQLYYVQRNCIAIFLGPSIKPLVCNSTITGSGVAVFLGTASLPASYPLLAKYPHITSCDFEGNLIGIGNNTSATGPGLRMNDVTILGAQLAVTSLIGPPSVAMALMLAGEADIHDLYVANFENSAILIQALAGGVDVRFGLNCTIENCNLNTAAYTPTNVNAMLNSFGITSYPGLSAPTPAIAADTSVTAWVPFNTRFTNIGTSNKGGLGTFQSGSGPA